MSSKEKHPIVDIKDILNEELSDDDEGDKLLKVALPRQGNGPNSQTPKSRMDLTPTLAFTTNHMRQSVASSTRSIKPRISWRPSLLPGHSLRSRKLDRVTPRSSLKSVSDKNDS